MIYDCPASTRKRKMTEDTKGELPILDVASQDALEKDATAQTFFDTLNGANRYAILYRLHDAKKPDRRAWRLDTFITMLKEHPIQHGRLAGHHAGLAWRRFSARLRAAEPVTVSHGSAGLYRNGQLVVDRRDPAEVAF